MSYYDDELESVMPPKGEILRIKLTSDAKSTKWMDLNIECIESVQAFMESIKRNLTSELIQIQTILYKPSFKSEYWMKKGKSISKKISKDKWFKLYDLPGTVVLPPLTKEEEK